MFDVQKKGDEHFVGPCADQPLQIVFHRLRGVQQRPVAGFLRERTLAQLRDSQQQRRLRRPDPPNPRNSAAVAPSAPLIDSNRTRRSRATSTEVMPGRPVFRNSASNSASDNVCAPSFNRRSRGRSRAGQSRTRMTPGAIRAGGSAASRARAGCGTLFCTSSSRAFMSRSRRGTLEVMLEAATVPPGRYHAGALPGPRRGGRTVAYNGGLAPSGASARRFAPRRLQLRRRDAPGGGPSFRHDCVRSGRPAFYRTAGPAEKVITAFTATTIKHEHH